MVNREMAGVGCAILAGGRSRRMGRDKAGLEWGKMSLARHIYDLTRPLFDEFFFVSSHHTRIEGIDAPFIRDALPREGPMVGIVSALMHAESHYVFVLGCDMPFITAQAIRFMIDQVGGEDIIVPRTEKGYEPLHAIYGRSCLSAMLTWIAKGQRRLTGVFPFLTLKVLGDMPVFRRDGISIFTNINTEEELVHARSFM